MAEDYTVGRVAHLAGITVRTLHHYDEISLVVPSGRTPSGYRVYELSDIERLSRVLTYRALGFSLDQIAALLDDPSVDEMEHLRKQRALLVERGGQLAAMVDAIDRELEARAVGMQLTPEEQLEVFGTDKVGGELLAFADAMRSGVPANSAEGMALADQHRAFVTTWFYDCSYAMHRSLAEMYVADERFTATFDTVAPGLAAYVSAAIIANAGAQES